MKCHICHCVGLSQSEVGQAREIVEGYDTLCVECARWLAAPDRDSRQYNNLQSFNDLLRTVSDFLGSGGTTEDIESIANALRDDPRFPGWNAGADRFERFFSLLPNNLYDYTSK
jgi:hypothetical protein